METEQGYLGVRVPADMQRAVEEAARKQDRTVSSWVRTQIRHVLADGEQTRREQKRQQADN